MHNNKISNKFLIFPYVTIVGYILITMILSFFGPVKFPYYSFILKLLVFTFILLFLIFTVLGFKIGEKKSRSKNYKLIYYSSKKLNNKLLYLSIFVLVIKLLLVISTIRIEGFPEFSTFFDTIARVYTDNKRSETYVNIYRRIDTFFSFISLFFILTSLYNWRYLTKVIKLFLITVIGLDLIYDLFFIGTQRAIINIVIYVFAVYIIRTFQKGKILNIRSFIKYIFFAFGILFILSLFLNARFEVWNSTRAIIHSNGIIYDLNNFFLYLIPQQMKYQFTTIISYVTQGYYGLGLTLTIPFEWTLGLGSSRAINSIVAEILPQVSNLINMTYPLRAESIYGYPGMANWHTIFPWLASDFTFIGSIIYMSFVAYIYIQTYYSSVKNNNAISFTLFTLLTIQYIFVPANNQLFINRGDTISIIIFFILWIIYRRRKYYIY